MDDLISRQAAISALCEECSKECNNEPCEFYPCREAEEIERVPPAQPEQRWIPCSERLPKKDGRYQVTRYDYVTNTEFIDILWYEKNLWWNGHSMGDYAVTAWMPLPEPYKEVKDESERV